MNFIRTLIDNLLGVLNEKELEIPLRALLRSIGHITIFEKTVHGPGEHGKDIVSLNRANGVLEVNVFLLKTRDISLSRFRTEVKPQLDPMFQVPVSHPMVKGNEQTRYIFVSTGDLSPDTMVEFQAYNKDNVRITRPKIELWSRSMLVNLFYENMESLPAFSSSFQDKLARIWLDIKSGKYNRSDWLDLASTVANSSAEDQSAKPLLFLGLATSFLVSQAHLSKEFFVAFDIFRIALVNLWIAVSGNEKRDLAIFDQLHDEYCSLVGNYVYTLKEDISRKDGLFKGENGAIESILYPLRTFSLLGIISYLAGFWREKGDREKENQLVEVIETVIRNNSSTLTPITDSLRKDVAITLGELCRSQKVHLAEKWIEDILENLDQRYIRSGWWPTESDNSEDIIEDTFHFEERNKQPSSFLIPILFSFCARLGAQRVYDRYRVLFGDFRLLEFKPPSDTALAELELVKGTLEHGSTIEKSFPRDFQDYSRQISQIRFERYSPIEKNRRYVLHLITEIHSHYVFPEIYLNFDDG